MDRLKHVFVLTVLIVLVLVFFILELSREQAKIIENLKSLSPLFLGITFTVLVLLLIIGFKDIFLPFKSLKKNQWMLVVPVLLFAFVLSFFVSPKTHRLYFDENIYMHIGQNIAQVNKAQMVNFGEIRYGELIVNQGEYNKQPNGYPFFLSLFYRIFGHGENLSFLINNLVFVLSTFVVFLLGYLFFLSFKTGLYAALIFAVIPQNILWHNTTAVEPSNTLFLALTVLLFLIYLSSKKSLLFYLSLVSACFVAQFRIESVLIFPLLLIFLLIKNPQSLKNRNLYFVIPLVLFLLLPHIVHVFSFQGHAWGADQAKYSLSYLGLNLKANGLFFLNNKDFPVLLTAFLLIGFLFKGAFREKIKLLIWLLLFWGVFLFFYAGNYYYGADIRFVLMTFPPLSLLAAFGFDRADKFVKNKTRKDYPLALVLIFIAFLSFAPRARTVGQEAWAARADHKYARSMVEYIPEDGIVFTHNPNMFLFWGKSAAQASLLAGYDQIGIDNLKNNFRGGIYFHFNFWCNVSDPLQKSFCRNILEKFPHQEIVHFQERDYTYILYKLD